MTEALARGGEDVGGLLHLVLLVARSLGVLGERRLLLLAHLVELLLGLFELAQVSGEREREEDEEGGESWNKALTMMCRCSFYT